MTGPVEEAGTVAGSLISNLKEAPVTLALILFNLCFVAAVYFGGVDNRNHQEKQTAQLFEQLDKSQALLAQCVAKP
jgi:hypothetical protein